MDELIVEARDLTKRFGDFLLENIAPTCGGARFVDCPNALRVKSVFDYLQGFTHGCRMMREILINADTVCLALQL